MILVVFVFLRSVRTTFIPSVAVPVSLIGTFGVMYLFGYSVDNLSLMALTIATGFVVDDAIVVIENITRHLEAGMHANAGRSARRAGDRLHGAFDQHLADRRVHSDSADGRHRGRLFREFAVTLSVAIVDFAGGLADHHADDVRAPAAPPTRTARPHLRSANACFDKSFAFYRVIAALGDAAPAADADRDAFDHRHSPSTSTSSSPRDFSRSRTPAVDRADSSRSGHFFPGHADALLQLVEW